MRTEPLTYATPQYDGLVHSIELLCASYRERLAGLPAGDPGRAEVKDEFLSFLESWTADERVSDEFPELRHRNPSAYSNPCCD